MDYAYFSRIIKRGWDILLGTVVPEDKQLEALLSIDDSALRRNLPKADRIVEPDTHALFDYSSSKVRTLVWAMKYKCHPRVLTLLAKAMYEEILSIVAEHQSLVGVENVFLVPIPSSKYSRLKRGWNQSEELCKKISEVSSGSMKVLNILEKYRETEHQTKLDRARRLKNVRDSMRATTSLPKNSITVVIDDVYTTGATCGEARRALRLAKGSAHIICLTVAH